MGPVALPDGAKASGQGVKGKGSKPFNDGSRPGALEIGLDHITPTELYKPGFDVTLGPVDMSLLRRRADARFMTFARFTQSPIQLVELQKILTLGSN